MHLRPGRPGVACPLAALLLTALACPSPTAADVFHLSSGGRIDGELLERTDEHYKIRTVLGLLTLSTDAVVRVEAAPSPFEEYKERSAAAADDAAAQFELARWCGEAGLIREQRSHLQRAIEIDPDFEPARRQLGYVRVGGLWVEARPAENGEAGAGRAATKPAEDQDPAQLARAIQAGWHRRISAIRTNMLESVLPNQVVAGRQAIAEIDDPLAIVPLVQILSQGNFVCREVLVEALVRCREAVATVNLAALALADPEREIRRRSIVELARRQDERVYDDLREALGSDDDVLIRRAAEAIGGIGVTSAVPDLIGNLKARRWRHVSVPIRTYFGALGQDYGDGYVRVGQALVPIRPYMALPRPVVQIQEQRRLMHVTVFRTEVLEALRRITDQDYGFDEAAWTRWYKESNP